jgi:16S rRNA G966 N2-methylase RsmD
VHPYFTRRAANVVRTYIQHFTEAGEYVLDPFGGSGVTAVEAMLLNRRGIHNDINPLANFIASQIADVSREDSRYIRRSFLDVETQCRKRIEQIKALTETELERRLAKVELPANIQMPSSSDARTYFDLFSPRQLLALATLKQCIDRLSDPATRGALLLAWSATLGKLNKTFLSARGRIESRGGSSIFSIYRYKLADKPVELPVWPVFRERVNNVIAGKEEVLKQKRFWIRTGGWRGGFEAYNLDIAELPAAIGRKVDYIFTDPPYGGHIAYLDLSILWNHWMGLDVPLSAREREIIVGGELRLTEEHYLQRLRESVTLCLQMLKPNRWFSIVFQHWNVRYFEAILEEAARSGETLKTAVTQIGDTIWSMHKKKNREKVLAGEMILSFINDGQGRIPVKRALPDRSTDELIEQVLSDVSPDGRPFAGELLFNRIVLKAWDEGALHSVDLAREDLAELLMKKGWQYNAIRHHWFNRKDTVPTDLQFAF